MKIVIDTSVYIDYLRSGKGLYSSLVQKGIRGNILYTPSIVALELLAGKSAGTDKGKQIIKSVLKPTKFIDLTKQLAELAGGLIRDDLVEETEDSIIAASALYLNAELATQNTKHFSKIKGLKFFTS